MYALILTVIVAGSPSSTSLSNFQTLALCEAAAQSHSARIVERRFGLSHAIVVTTCAKNQEK